MTILLVQFVAFCGALLFGRLAEPRRRPADDPRRPGPLDGGRDDRLLPAGPQFAAVPALAALIGIVLGGTQALSRSLYSQLIPRGREAEYFSLYQACERGTSWFGTLLFGLVQQCDRLLPLGDHRPGRLLRRSGGSLLARVDVRRGIIDAGNEAPGGRLRPVQTGILDSVSVRGSGTVRSERLGRSAGISL